MLDITAPMIAGVDSPFLVVCMRETNIQQQHTTFHFIHHVSKPSQRVTGTIAVTAHTTFFWAYFLL